MGVLQPPLLVLAAQPDQPVIWRGPMVSNAFDKMLTGTEWGALDVLLVDMPPGGPSIASELPIETHGKKKKKKNADRCCSVLRCVWTTPLARLGDTLALVGGFLTQKEVAVGARMFQVVSSWLGARNESHLQQLTHEHGAGRVPKHGPPGPVYDCRFSRQER